MVVFLLFMYYVLIKPKKLKKTYVYSYSRYFNGPSNKIIFVRPKKKMLSSKKMRRASVSLPRRVTRGRRREE